MRLLLSAIIVSCVASAASAQVFYLPVQYQYGQGERYYYGGSDPAVFASAERTSAMLRFHRSNNPQPRVYSDLFPYANAAWYGFTPTDARNEAYRNQPRYFRKADLLDHAVEVDGAVYVPPAPPRRYVAPHVVVPMIEAPKPAPRPRGVIIIIPKKPAELKTPARTVQFVSAD